MTQPTFTQQAQSGGIWNAISYESKHVTEAGSSVVDYSDALTLVENDKERQKHIINQIVTIFQTLKPDQVCWVITAFIKPTESLIDAIPAQIRAHACFLHPTRESAEEAKRAKVVFMVNKNLRFFRIRIRKRG